ncbi:hypothetical protein MHYP_G00103170 [Metynnis hypsauchen]
MVIFSIIIVVILTPAGISAVTTVTGHRGQSVQIKCPYDSGYETYMKYLCRGECSVWRTKDIPVQSGSAEDQRFSLDDDTAARIFTITITDLRPEDGGTYWCGIKRPKPLPDLYTEILLLVKLDPTNPSAVSQTTHLPLPPTTETSDDSNATQSSPTSSVKSTQLTPSSGSIILYLCVSLLVSGIALGVLVLFCKRQKKLYTLSGSLSSIISQRDSRRHEERTNNENYPYENHDSIIISPVYQRENPETSQLDSVYQRVDPDTSQADFQNVTIRKQQRELFNKNLRPERIPFPGSVDSHACGAMNSRLSSPPSS